MNRRLAAILAADVVGYSRMMEADESRTLGRLKALTGELIRPRIDAHRGVIVKTTGDGFLVEFSSIIEAVECAVEIQRAMADSNRNETIERQVRFRIGINIGDIISDEGDIFGDGVNIAARLEGLADPGGICVHRDVRSQIRNRLSVDFEDMGEVEVKNISRPLRVYKVIFDGRQPSPAYTTWAKPWRARVSGRPVVGAALVLVVLLAAGLLLWQRKDSLLGSDTPAPAVSLPTDKPSIAVFPFTNMSSDPEQKYFADGITADLITRLSALSGLFVIARPSAQADGGTTASPQLVGRNLGVRYVLDGSVRKAGDRLRINASLVGVDNGRQVWADQYDRQLTDIFALQDEVVGHIVSALAIKLTNAEETRITRTPTDNLEAYDYYLRAETEGYYKLDFETFGRALAYYAKAIELDPNFADAHAGYARAAVEVWRLGVDQVMPGPLARKRAYDAAGIALKIDPNNSRAYTVLAILQLNEGRHQEAIRSAEQAVKLKPNDAEAYANLAMTLSFAGRPDEAIAAIEQAALLNPNPPPGLQLLAGIVFFNARQYDRAVASLEPVAKLWNDSEIPHEYLAAAYAKLGQLDQAKEQLASMLKFPWINWRETRRLYEDSYKTRGDLDHFIEALGKAGMPEWAYGFQGRPENRVRGEELAKLTRSQLLNGHSPVSPSQNVPFVIQFDDNGRFAYRGVSTLLTGEARVSDDQLCMRFSGYLNERWVCGDVFRSAGNSGIEDPREEYVYVLSDGLRYFSPQPK